MNTPLPDGLLRVRRQDLGRIVLTHLTSGLDEEMGDAGPARCGASTSLSGYTEWISPQEPQLSLGWDWQFETRPSAPGVTRLGLPRTNVQVVDADQTDLPWEQSLEVLARFIDTFDWNTPAFRAVCARYAT